MSTPFTHLTTRGGDLLEALGLAWQSLGIFAWLFAAMLLIAGVYLVRGWRQLARHASPFDQGPEAEDLLTSAATQRLSADTVDRQLFRGRGQRQGNLFWRYISRFSQRDRGQPPGASLTQATEELWQLGQVQQQVVTLRFLAMVLPALGLLGTLIGMFNAFFTSDFGSGGALANTMEALMQNFALALFTTIVAVLLKIVVDLLTHFTLSAHLTRLRGDLARVRTLMLSAAEAPIPPRSPAAEPSPTPAAEPSHA